MYDQARRSWGIEGKADPGRFFHLRQIDVNTWDLYRVDADGDSPVFYRKLTRARGY
jgi:hypothetical protein